jgi:hypothetical protein
MQPTHNTIRTQAPQLTPRDDVRKTVSEALKRVDSFIRQGELDQAERCVVQAREIDPKNIYAYAFLERINILKEQARENSLAVAACKVGEEKKSRSNEQIKATGTSSPQAPQKSPSLSRSDSPAQRANESSKPTVSCPPKVVSVQPETKTATQAGTSHRTADAPANVRSAAPQQGGIQRTSEEERNAKIQQMIKVAVESVRKEVEQKQMEIRAHEREEFMRREQVRIKEAAETARREEERRQMELRKGSEERLQQKIHQILQQKLANKPAADTVPSVNENLPAPSGRDTQEPHAPLPQPPLSAERSETLERYKLVLSSVWADGAVSPEEDATLKELRESL